MTTKVKSIRGVEVDFDLLKIKQNINTSPKTPDIVARERFIDKKRRRTNRKVSELLAQQEEAKRYAEEAIKLQQEQRASNATAIQPPVVTENKPNTDVSSNVGDTSGKTQESFKRKINK